MRRGRPESHAMTLTASPRPTRTSEWTTHELALVVRRVASQPQLWRPKVRFTAERFWTRLPGPDGVDVWLLTWLPSQATDLHDHGDSAAAFAVVQGALTEVRADDVLGVWSTTLHAPAVRVVEPGIVHDVRNDLVKPAVSIHAYGPRLERMRYYDVDEHGALVETRTVWSRDPELSA
jgi:hypothetical protein